jgi:hypothetical protein
MVCEGVRTRLWRGGEYAISVWGGILRWRLRMYGRWGKKIREFFGLIMCEDCHKIVGFILGGYMYCCILCDKCEKKLREEDELYN